LHGETIVSEDALMVTAGKSQRGDAGKKKSPTTEVSGLKFQFLQGSTTILQK